MIKEGTIICPEHGEFAVSVEDTPITIMRFKIAGNSVSDRQVKRYTSKCPRCKRRLLVKFSRKSK